MLPFGLMAVEMLQQQGSVAAVVPHILGVLCAHFHHFFAVVWPRIMLEENGGDAPGPRSKAARAAGRARAAPRARSCALRGAPGATLASVYG